MSDETSARSDASGPNIAGSNEDFARELSEEELARIEREHDEGAATRPVGPLTGRILRGVALTFAIYHYLTAGFGLPADHWHMGWHLAGLFILIYAFFPILKTSSAFTMKTGSLRFGNIPVLDLVLMVLGVSAALYLGLAWRGVPLFGIEEQTFRMGNPNGYDMVFGCVLIVLVLDIARRTLGWVLPAIIGVFIAYALLGPWIPVQILQHPGVRFNTFVSSMYFPQEGIFGVTLWVVSTIVFHFVLFGVIAQRTGLGQLFIDNATILAGRYTGGPAKVSVVSSAFFGTISGSSVANTVSTGALTIPNMKRLGYPGHFAGGVEAAASAGGQITPPIMGAAAFIMAEFLEVPYTTIVVAAIVPALMHYVGVMSIVHFTALKLGLPSYSRDELPRFLRVWREGWHTIIPLVALLVVLFNGYTPNMAAFCGLLLCVIVGFASPSRPLTLIVPAAFAWFVMSKAADGGFSPVMAGFLLGLTALALLHRRGRQPVGALFDSLHVGVQYALAVGAAAAAVGIVIGVINTTGVAFRVGFMVTNGAAQMAEGLYGMMGWMPEWLVTQASLQRFLSLVLVAMACILMGAGLPTTALYIMLVSVAQPALAQLGIPALATHMFVLYYGVISEITPPVCASAYAAAGIAGSNPFRTGVTAFSLGVGKLLVPMVFVYAPVILIVLDEHFTWLSFVQVTLTCAAGVSLIGAAYSAYLTAPLGGLWRLLTALAGILLVAPGWQSDLAGLLVAAPVILSQMAARRGAAQAAAK